MRELLTLRDLARLSEQEAVDADFDGRNLRALWWFAAGAAFYCILGSLISFTEGVKWVGLLQGLNALAAAVLVVVLWGRGSSFGVAKAVGWRASLAGILLQRVRLLSIALLLAQAFLLLLYHDGWRGDGGTVWYMVYPFLVVPFRFRPEQHGTVHGVLFGAAVVDLAFPLLIGGEVAQSWAILIAPAVINGFALGLEILLGRRRQREVLRHWRAAMEQNRDHLRMRQEVEDTREIQLSMLPREWPDLSWLEVASLSLPATEVGGDYYDYFRLGDDGLAIVAGDVAGHGVASGLVLAGIRSGLTLLSEEIRKPLEVLARLDRMVKETTRQRVLITLSILILDRVRRLASLSSAGHPPLLFRRAHEDAVEMVELPSKPLGCELPGEFGHREWPLSSGDVLVLYSDGLYETTDEAGEPFGWDRLVETLQVQPKDASAAELREALLTALWAYKGDAPQLDDVTLVVLKLGELDR